MNILDYVNNLIQSDSFIKNKVNNRVYYYKTTENTDFSGSFIVLTPIEDAPDSYVSNNYLAENYFFQVDVESSSDKVTTEITKRIRRILFEVNLIQSSSVLDDYFEVTKRYVKSRRYKGIPKNQYYKGERIN